ncbi:hypothetical protein I3842_05G244700 [Carya illinoinensis]|uniref:Uncharacterized protein n=1 Tax=Carya illinoinensis TaxID=32201 RepID=A0A922F8Q6_CARIL|nr:hypothetical protein I3842_05G244700 [Carya illinoinensis]
MPHFPQSVGVIQESSKPYSNRLCKSVQEILRGSSGTRLRTDHDVWNICSTWHKSSTSPAFIWLYITYLNPASGWDEDELEAYALLPKQVDVFRYPGEFTRFSQFNKTMVSLIPHFR